jgi:hypothetical protein
MIPEFLTVEERVKIEAEEHMKEVNNGINPYGSYSELLYRS